MTNSGRSNSNTTGSKPATFIESVHNDGCWFTDFLLPSDVVEQSVLENSDIDSVPPMDPNHNAAAVGFLAMESVGWFKHCDWDPLAAQSRCHHFPLPTARSSHRFHCQKTSSSSIVIGIHWRHRVDVTFFRSGLLNKANRFHCQEPSSSSIVIGIHGGPRVDVTFSVTD